MDSLLKVDLVRLKHFVMLASTLNFTRAAKRLNMVQPALSTSIRRLETDLGVRLFDRDTRVVALTPIGGVLLDQARQLVSDAERLVQSAQNNLDGTTGILRIGFIYSATFGLLQQLLRQLSAQLPHVEASLVECVSSERAIRRLEAGKIEVALVRSPIRIESPAVLIELQQDSFVVAVPRASPLAIDGPVRLTDLAEAQFIQFGDSGLGRAVKLACQHAGFVPRGLDPSVQVQTVLALVESGRGIALVPSAMQRYHSEAIVYRPLLDELPVRFGLALAYIPSSETSVTRQFRALAQSAQG